MKYRLTNILSYIALGLFILIFIGLSLLEVIQNQLYLQSALILIFIIPILVFGMIEIFRHNRNAAINIKRELSLILIMGVAATLTWFLNNDLGMGLVISSALIGMFAYLTSIFIRTEFIKKLPVAVYCATFVGMTSSLVLDFWFLVLFAGVFCGFLYVFTKNVFAGVGGKLGLMACFSVSITILLLNLFEVLILWIY